MNYQSLTLETILRSSQSDLKKALTAELKHLGYKVTVAAISDILGMKHGVPHDIKVVAVTADVEVPATESIVNNITPMEYDRSGVAFSKISPLGIANGGTIGGRNSWSVGAYNSDGTLKDDAIVIYVTNDTVDTVTVNITGTNSNPYTFTGLSSFSSQIAYAYG